jgi:preprotein translocase subunit YajC
MNKLLKASLFLQTLFFSAIAFAEGGEETMPPRDDNFWQTMSMIAIAIVFFYLILWRPEQKRRKAMEAQRNALKKGDRVTVMGILGIISKVQDQTVIVRMVDGAKIEVLKAAISDVAPGTEEDAKKAE